MASLIGNLFTNVSDKSADQTIAFHAMAAAAGSAVAYLGAVIESTTPEVRRLFSEYTTQSMMAHEALTNLSINKGWIGPYDSPVKQLEASLQQSQTVVENVQ